MRKNLYIKYNDYFRSIEFTNLYIKLFNLYIKLFNLNNN